MCPSCSLMHNIYIKREGGREWYTPGWVFPCTSITRAKQPKSTRKMSMVYSVHFSQKKKARPLQRYLTAAHMFKLKLSKDLFHLHDQVPFPILIITFSSFYLNSPCIYDTNTPVKGYLCHFWSSFCLGIELSLPAPVAWTFWVFACNI